METEREDEDGGCYDCGEPVGDTVDGNICQPCQVKRDTPCEDCGETDGEHSVYCGWTEADHAAERGCQRFHELHDEGLTP